MKKKKRRMLTFNTFNASPDEMVKEPVTRFIIFNCINTVSLSGEELTGEQTIYLRNNNH